MTHYGQLLLLFWPENWELMDTVTLIGHVILVKETVIGILVANQGSYASKETVMKKFQVLLYPLHYMQLIYVMIPFGMFLIH